MHTECVWYQVRYCWQPLSSAAVSSVVCAFELHFTFCQLHGLLPFHRPYLGALVIGCLGYPRFETLLLFYRSGVSRILVFWFGALSIFDPLALWWSAVFRGNIHPSLGSWSSQCLCLLLRVWFWDSGQIFRKKFEAPIHPPSGRHFRSFRYKSAGTNVALPMSASIPAFICQLFQATHTWWLL
jgi:hypothetical protein